MAQVDSKIEILFSMPSVVMWGASLVCTETFFRKCYEQDSRRETYRPSAGWGRHLFVLDALAEKTQRRERYTMSSA